MTSILEQLGREFLHTRRKVSNLILLFKSLTVDKPTVEIKMLFLWIEIMNSKTLKLNWRRTDGIPQFVTMESIEGHFQMI